MTDRYADTDTWPNPPASQQPARPTTLAASEPSRVLGEGSVAQEAREASYAEAIRRLFVVSPEQMRDLVDAVMAVADAEQAGLRADFDDRLGLIQREYRKAAETWDRQRDRLNDEIERLRGWIDRAEAAEAEVERLRDEYSRAAKYRDEYRDDAHDASDALVEMCSRVEAAEAEVERLNEDCRIHLMKRHAALAEVTGLRDRLGRVEALCLCKADGCPCGGDRVVVPTRDLRAALAPPVTGDTEDASPAAEATADDEAAKVEAIRAELGRLTERWEVEKATPHCPTCGSDGLPRESSKDGSICPDDFHSASLDAGPASPTEQATEAHGLSGWFRETPKALALLAEETKALAELEAEQATEGGAK